MATRKKATDVVSAEGSAIVQAETRMNLAKQGDQEQIAVALDKYGFAGYTVDQVVAEGKLRARRFVEDILELGRIVLACRELPRGMYGAAIAQMGISNDTARRVAGVALKFWNRDHLKPLLTLDTSKVYELALLDDASLANIAEDPEAIDDIDRMSVSELRASLREAKDEILAKDAVAQDLQNTIRKQKEKIARTPAPTSEFLAEEALSLLDQEALQCAAALTTSLRSRMTAAMAAIDVHGADRRIIEQACGAALGRIFAAGRQLAADFNVLPQDGIQVDASTSGDASWDAVNKVLEADQGAGKRNAKRHA